MPKKATNPQNLRPDKRPRGRPKGVKNKISGTIKEQVIEVWERLQANPKLSLYGMAAQNPEWFYSTFGRALIPRQVDVDAKVEGDVNHHIVMDFRALRDAIERAGISDK